MNRHRPLLIAAVLMQASGAWAWNPLAALSEYKKPNMRIGQLELHPYYGLSVLYDDNIYLVGRDKADGTRTGCFPGLPGFAASAAGCSGGIRGSLIVRNNAGLKLALPVGNKHLFNAGYDFTANNYKTQARANDAVAHGVSGQYSFKGAVLGVNLFDNFVNTEDPAFNPNNVVSGELVQRERRWQNTVGGSIEYALGDIFFISADGQDTVHKYLNPTFAALLNRSETIFGGKVGYKLQPKTRAYLGVHRGLYHYSAIPANRTLATTPRVANHKDWSADLGLQGDLAPNLKGMVQAGFSYRAYDADDLRSNQKHVARDAQAQVQLAYKPAQRTEVLLIANRGFNEAVSGGNYYISTGLSLKGTQTWGKLAVSANGGWQIDKYSQAITLPPAAQGGGHTANRRDDLYTAGLKVDYKFQEWLLTGVSYQHKARFSIFTDQFNYRNNVTAWDLKLVF